MAFQPFLGGVRKITKQPGTGSQTSMSAILRDVIDCLCWGWRGPKKMRSEEISRLHRPQKIHLLVRAQSLQTIGLDGDGIQLEVLGDVQVASS